MDISDFSNGVLRYKDKNVLIITDSFNNYWFKAKNICEILEYKDGKKAIKQHLKPGDYKKYIDILRGGETPPQEISIIIQDQTVFINEASLYKLLFRSKMSRAEEFTDWVTKDILPNIRKFGEYRLKTRYENEISVLKEGIEELKAISKGETKKIKSYYKSQMRELKEYYREYNKSLKDTLEKFEIRYHNDTNELKEKINTLESNLKDRVINPIKESKRNYLAILQDKLDENMFKFIRGQKHYIEKMIARNEATHYLFYKRYEPNSITCINEFKDRISKYIDCNYNDFKLVNVEIYDIYELIEDLNRLDIERAL